MHTHVHNVLWRECGNVESESSLTAVSRDAEVAAAIVARRDGLLVVLSGAGMSQESGVPTFRDAQTGLWARYDPLELATLEAFRTHPARVFGWYVWRYQLVQRAQPNAGHYALAAMQRALDGAGAAGQSVLVVTQNVDGLHQRAGTTDVVELHGSLQSFRCLGAGHPYDATAIGEMAVPPDGEVDPPACPACGSPVRPGVVWFGEMLPQASLERAYRAARACAAMLVVGTSGVVYPAAALPEIALSRAIPVIEISPEPTALSPHVTLSWRATSGMALPLLERALAAPGGA